MSNTLEIYDAIHNIDRNKQSADVQNEEIEIDDDEIKIHHSVMRQEIANLKIFRSYFPITLIIGKSETGKSTLASVVAANPETTTIFENWNEVRERVQVELDLIDEQIENSKSTDISLAKKMVQNMVINKDLTELDTTTNRPRAAKFVGLVETAYDKFEVLKKIIEPAIDVLSEMKMFDKQYSPGEIPIVYYNESLQDAIFHYPIFILIATEGQESGGSRHRVTLQIRNIELSGNKDVRTKVQKMIGDKYYEDDTFGVKYVTCFPVDLMVYFSLIGPVRVTSINSSTFSSKSVVSNTQKGGLSDSVVNTPNYIANTIRIWGGRIIMEVRDDWDRSDTLFGAGDLTVEIKRRDNGSSYIYKFRMRDGTLGREEYFAIKNIYELIFCIALRCVNSDLLSDLQLLQSLVKFLDAFILFADNQKVRINKLLIENKEHEIDDSSTTMVTILSSIEGFIQLCNSRDMPEEVRLFTEIRDLYAKKR